MTALDRAVKFTADMTELSKSTYYSPRNSGSYAARPILHAVLTATMTGNSVTVDVSRIGGLTGEDIAAILKSVEAHKGELTMTISGGANVTFA